MTDELFDLTHGVAIVTGGGTGIGAATARMLAEHGADVIVAARTLAEVPPHRHGPRPVPRAACDAHRAQNWLARSDGEPHLTHQP